VRRMRSWRISLCRSDPTGEYVMKILIVDDSPDALAVAQARLANENVEIVCAEGGVAGFEAARQQKPDLILLDIDMPDMSGFEVCRALKADVDLCMIPVLFLSGSRGIEDRVKGLDLGAVDYVTKPFDSFELRARVRAALRTKRLQDLLIEHAQLDPLTGLPNRRVLMERLQQEWARTERYNSVLSFIMADVDHFKRVNDTHGHPAGDIVLQEIARVITAACRQTDLPARYGGEEFAILVPNEVVENAICLADRCRSQIEGLCIRVDSKAILTTASFGVVDSRHVASPEALIQSADSAMYRAKQEGRNRVVSRCCSADEAICAK
jgi:two-component system, cell cycle response regulator